MWVTLIPLIIQILAELPSLIQAAETAFGSKSGNGAAKKTFVQDVIGVAVEVYNKLSPTPVPPNIVTTVQSAVSPLIDSTVAVMNAVDAFKAKPAIAPVTPSVPPVTTA